MKHLAAGLLLFCWLPLWGQVTNLHFTNLSIDAGLSDKWFSPWHRTVRG